MKPVDVSGLDMALGGGPDMMTKLMVPMSDIPKEFKNWNSQTKWNKLQSTWFYEGLPKGTEFKPKEGIDATQALRHLKTIQGSFEPKHEHKEACVAYLMSLWFDDVVVPAK